MGTRSRRALFSCRAIIRGWPWYYETTPIFDNEILLRTVPNSVGYYSKNLGNWNVNPLAFEPAEDDADGISIFREDFVTKEYLASVNKYPTGVRVARISAKEFTQLGLTLKPSPISDGPSGHTLVPEMPYLVRSPSTKPLKQKIKNFAQQLAQIATSNGVFTPAGLPDPVPRAKN